MPRTIHVSRGIVLAAFIMSVAIGLAACTPPLPPDVLAAKAEAEITCQSGAQDVSVPDDFSGAMTAVSGSLTGACPEQSIAEVAADQPAGVMILDHAPSPADITAFDQVCKTAPIVVPVFAYAVVATYNIIGLEGLVLPPDVIAAMLQGRITAWDDPAIQAANEGYDLTGLPPITIMSVQSPTGSVQAMTTWLSQAAPSAWVTGPAGTIATGQQYPTTADLVADLTVTDGAFAILPAVVAVNNSLPMAALPVQDLTIGPDDVQLLKVGSGATTITKDEQGNLTATPAIGGIPVEGNFDAAAAKIVLAEGQPMVGWPVLGYAHAMVCDDPADPLPLSTVQYIERLAGQGSLETFGVTPLPEPIRIQTFIPLKVKVNLDAEPSGSAPASAAAPTNAEPIPSAS